MMLIIISVSMTAAAYRLSRSTISILSRHDGGLHLFQLIPASKVYFGKSQAEESFVCGNLVFLTNTRKQHELLDE